MITVIQKYTKDRKGQTLVEFALVLALLLAILFGIVEFGRAMFYSNHLTNTVRSAARYAAVLGDNFDKDLVEDYVEQEIDFSMNKDDIASGSNGIVIDVYAPDGVKRAANANPARGDTITVTVNYNFTVLSGSIIPYFRGEHPISRSASMKFE